MAMAAVQLYLMKVGFYPDVDARQAGDVCTISSVPDVFTQNIPGFIPGSDNLSQLYVESIPATTYPWQLIRLEPFWINP